MVAQHGIHGFGDIAPELGKAFADALKFRRSAVLHLTLGIEDSVESIPNLRQGHYPLPQFLELRQARQAILQRRHDGGDNRILVEEKELLIGKDAALDVKQWLGIVQILQPRLYAVFESLHTLAVQGEFGFDLGYIVQGLQFGGFCPAQIAMAQLLYLSLEDRIFKIVIAVLHRACASGLP